LLLPSLDELVEVPDVEQEFPKLAVLSAAPPIGWQGEGHGPESTRLHHVSEGEETDPQVPRGPRQGEQPRQRSRPQAGQATDRRAGEDRSRADCSGFRSWSPARRRSETVMA
jgi:hypothetical protein